MPDSFVAQQWRFPFCLTEILASTHFGKQVLHCPQPPLFLTDQRIWIFVPQTSRALCQMTTETSSVHPALDAVSGVERGLHFPSPLWLRDPPQVSLCPAGVSPQPLDVASSPMGSGSRQDSALPAESRIWGRETRVRQGADTT